MKTAVYGEAVQTKIFTFGAFEPVEGAEFVRAQIREAHQFGVAPGQAFLLRIDQPRRVSVSWEYPSEYDIEWDWDLVRVCPWTSDMVRQNWDEVLSKYFE